jgi:AcrR family transcriptional regulator
MYRSGVNATSLDDVLAAAGAGKSGLYHYFADKSDLVRAVIDRQLELVLMRQPTIHHIDSWETIDAWVTQILDGHTAPGGPFACPLGSIAAELKNDEAFLPSIDAAFGTWEGTLARGLQRMKDAGQLDAAADADRLAAAVIAARRNAAGAHPW